MTEIITETVDHAYRFLLDELVRENVTIVSRGLRHKELTPPTIVRIKNPHCGLVTIPERKLNYHFAMIEYLWILSGREDVALPANYVHHMMNFSDDGVTLSGAYGPRVSQQLPWVIHMLSSDPGTRQAVMTIWKPCPENSKDIPCTVALQFFVRKNSVDLVVYMRSNDAWLGFPYDVFTFTQLQMYVAQKLGCGVGSYTHIAGSMHLYERDMSAAMRVVKAPIQAYPRLVVPAPTEQDVDETGLVLSNIWEAESSSRNYKQWCPQSHAIGPSTYYDLFLPVIRRRWEPDIVVPPPFNALFDRRYDA